MEQNVIKQVAKNSNVSEEEVRKDIAEALSFATGLEKGQSLDIDAIIALLANKVSEALEKK